MRSRARAGVVAAIAIATCFGLGLWSRPDASEEGRAAPALGSPAQVGGVQVAPRAAEGGMAARPDRAEASMASVAVDDDVLVKNQLGARLPDLFDAQPRDEAWAPAVEAFLEDELTKFFAVLVPDAEALTVECKTSMCKMDFVVAAERERVAFSRQQALPVGDVMQPWQEPLDDGRTRIGLYAAFGPEHRAFPELARRYQALYQERFPMPLDEVAALFERDDAAMAAEEGP